MKAILRTFVFIYISFYVTSVIVNAFYFKGNENLNLLIVLSALFLLNFCSPLLLGILPLPKGFVSNLIITFILNLVVFNILVIFLPGFNIVATNISELIILGIVLPSKGLSRRWALIFATLLFVVIYRFLVWLCKSKK